mmetsp:Transcript_49674/g.153454  ORF Transcript_49674/g.153454 Transcript_49674/m.153454 type:complete len:277 (-) Transcript_49674:2222-3052(-)
MMDSMSTTTVAGTSFLLRSLCTRAGRRPPQSTKLRARCSETSTTRAMRLKHAPSCPCPSTSSAFTRLPMTPSRYTACCNACKDCCSWALASCACFSSPGAAVVGVRAGVRYTMAITCTAECAVCAATPRPPPAVTGQCETMLRYPVRSSHDNKSITDTSPGASEPAAAAAEALPVCPPAPAVAAASGGNVAERKRSDRVRCSPCTATVPTARTRLSVAAGVSSVVPFSSASFSSRKRASTAPTSSARNAAVLSVGSGTLVPAALDACTSASTGASA